MEGQVSKEINQHASIKLSAYTDRFYHRTNRGTNSVKRRQGGKQAITKVNRFVPKFVVEVADPTGDLGKAE